MDFSKAFGATFRAVGTGERDGKPTHIVQASRVYSTTPKDLWSALTEKNRLRRWFGEVSGGLRLDGRYSIAGNADGTITQCNPPKLFSLTWEFGGSTSWVKVAVEDVDGGSRLTLTHELPTHQKSEAHWDMYGPGATGVGWEWGMLGLDVHLLTGDVSLTKAGEKWAESTLGKTTLRSWADAWGEAHIKAGTSAEIATGMAERTAQFYTGES